MLATVDTAAVEGTNSVPATIEVHIAPDGLPSFTIIGMPDSLCRIVRDRVRAAMLCSDMEWPQRRITVNVSHPRHVFRSSSTDLAVAVGVLAASEQISVEASAGLRIFGELGVDGRVHSSPGVLALCSDMPVETQGVVVPLSDSAAVKASVQKTGRTLTVLPAADLRSAVAALDGRAEWPPVPSTGVGVVADAPLDMADVVGNPLARKAAEVAAAGGHHLLVVGQVVTGRLMIAQRLQGLLPALTDWQSQEVSRIWSAAGMGNRIRSQPPCRAPHHSVSAIALLGGGTGSVRPGELSLAHHGVLALDDITEFSPFALDVLRVALDDREVRVSRASSTAVMPAKFLLAATMSRGPCGQNSETCECTENARLRYLSRLAGPLIDHFDLRVPVVQPTSSEREAAQRSESSAEIAARVARVRERSTERGGLNADLSGGTVMSISTRTPGATKLLRRQLNDGSLTSRGVTSLQRVALTLCDLEDDDPVITKDRLEKALELRPRMHDLCGLTATER